VLLERQVNKTRPFLYTIYKMDSEKWYQLLWNRMECIMSYTPTKLDIDIMLFLPEQKMAEYCCEAKDNNWSDVCSNVVTVHCEGNHETMLNSEYISNMAQKIQEKLNSII
jgi:thioesterase domain-containing protein